MKLKASICSAVGMMMFFASMAGVAEEVCGNVIGPSSPVTLICSNGQALGYDESKKSVAWAAFSVAPGQTLDAKAVQSVSKSGAVAQSMQVDGVAPEGYQWLALSPGTEPSKSAVHVVPAKPSIANDAWPELMRYVSSVAKRYEGVQVVTGAYSDLPYAYTEHQQVIPTKFYVAIYVPAKERGMAFLLPNETLGRGAVYDHLLTIDDLEGQVGVELFNTLDKDVERRVEGRISVATLW